MTSLRLDAFFDPARLAELRRHVDSCAAGLVLVVGVGATLAVSRPDIVLYADLARWEAQKRFRHGETGNLGANNCSQSASLKYKRAYFVDWRVADRFKKPLLESADFFLDTTGRDAPKLIEGEAIREGTAVGARRRPFRCVVPFFDPAPWGGQWMKKSPRSGPRGAKLRLVF